MLRTVAIAAAAVALAACGGSSSTCSGVETGGMCWTGRDGITLTEARAAEVYEIAKAYWGQPGDPEGWRIEFAISPVEHVDVDGSGGAVRHVVDGVEYFGWACRQHRVILVHPFGEADCIERSVIFHELGHAWGVHEGDARLYGEYDLMRKAMERTGWRGCGLAAGDDEGGR